MLTYFLRRLVYLVVLLWVVSLVAFLIIQLPPGDYLDSLLRQFEAQETEVSDALIASLRLRYGLDLPVHAQYLKWVGNLLQGDLGRSFRLQKPVAQLVGERLPLTLVVSITALLFVYLTAIPIGIYTATHQYSLGDYGFTVAGFAGLAMPNFLLALILMYLTYRYLGFSVGGLFSPQYITESWSVGKVVDLLLHLPIPIIVIGTAGTAGLIRVMRATLLDELEKQYVITARSKGVAERRLLFKYPVRIALNPIISTVGWTLPEIVSGETITAIVLSLPTTGPLLFTALMSQDMYLAASIVMILAVLTIVGTFLSDLLLVAVDPRIKFSAVGEQ